MNERLEKPWDQIVPILPRLDRLLQGVRDDRAIDEVSKIVTTASEGLGWEIGPRNGGNMFAFCLNGKVELLPIADQFLLSAPKIPGWIFYSGRPPRPYSDIIKVVHKGRSYDVDLSSWTYTLLKQGSGKPFDILMFPYPPAENGPHINIASILLVEFALGEREYLSKVQDVVVIGPSDKEIAMKESSTPVRFLAEHFASISR